MKTALVAKKNFLYFFLTFSAGFEKSAARSYWRVDSPQG
jgi:hypothetical protein